MFRSTARAHGVLTGERELLQVLDGRDRFERRAQ
jgi:hypothetical protein